MSFKLVENGRPLLTPASAPYSASQILSAYGFTCSPIMVAGQTIAIIDAFDAPTIGVTCRL